MGIFDKAKDALNSDKGEELTDKGSTRLRTQLRASWARTRLTKSTRLVTQLTASLATSK